MLDPKVRKEVLSRFTYGLYVATAADGEEVGGAGLTWVSQASFEPLLITAAIRRGSQLEELVGRTGRMVLHLPDAAQKDLVASFFRGARVEEGRVNGLAFERSERGGVILPDFPAHLELEVRARLDEGDHVVYLFEAVDVVLRRPFEPLELRPTGWSYGR